MIWQVVAAIPAGRVATYGQVARVAGYPGHARYVGSVLKGLPSNTRLPWHRVINAQGKSSFPVNSSAYNEQVKRLSCEGVDVSEGKISLARYGWAAVGLR